MGKLRSQLISSQISSIMSTLLTYLQEKRIGMSKMVYYVPSFVYGYVIQFFGFCSCSFINIQAYKCVFMGNGFWSASERKKKAAVGKINGLSQVTPATIAYAVTQVCFLSTFVQLTLMF